MVLDGQQRVQSLLLALKILDLAGCVFCLNALDMRFQSNHLRLKTLYGIKGLYALREFSF